MGSGNRKPRKPQPLLTTAVVPIIYQESLVLLLPELPPDPKASAGKCLAFDCNMTPLSYPIGTRKPLALSLHPELRVHYFRRLLKLGFAQPVFEPKVTAAHHAKRHEILQWLRQPKQLQAQQVDERKRVQLDDEFKDLAAGLFKDSMIPMTDEDRRIRQNQQAAIYRKLHPEVPKAAYAKFVRLHPKRRAKHRADWYQRKKRKDPAVVKEWERRAYFKRLLKKGKEPGYQRELKRLKKLGGTQQEPKIPIERRPRGLTVAQLEAILEKGKDQQHALNHEGSLQDPGERERRDVPGAEPGDRSSDPLFPTDQRELRQDPAAHPGED